MTTANAVATLAGVKTMTTRIIRPQPESLETVNWSIAPKAGERRYIKEPFRLWKIYDEMKPSEIERTAPVFHSALPEKSQMEIGRVRLARHMPQRMSRATVKITEVRARRLHDILEDECWREGLEPRGCPLNALANVLFRFPDLKIHLLSIDAPGLFHYCDDRASGDFGRITWTSATGAFAAMWEGIHGAGAWRQNPFVWSINYSLA